MSLRRLQVLMAPFLAHEGEEAGQELSSEELISARPDLFVVPES